MSPELKALIGLLRERLLQGESAWSWPSGIDGRRWLALVQENALDADLGALGLQVPQLVERALTGAYIRAGHDCAFSVVELPRLLGQLDIDGILLKGAALARVYYPRVAQRRMSDLDLLVRGKPQANRAHEALLSAGFRQEGPPLHGAHHHLPALYDPLRELRIELHTNLSMPELPAPEIEGLFERRRDLGQGLSVLEPLDRLLHHALHAVASPLDSPLLRNLFEIAALYLEVEEASIVPRARAWGKEEPILQGIGLATSIFELPCQLKRPEEGEFEQWCRERLEWTDAFDPEQSTARRLHKRIAHRRVEEAPDIPLWAVRWNVYLEAFKSYFVRRPKLVRTNPEISVRRLNEGALIHDAVNGGVHYLAPSMAGALQMAEQPISLKALRRALRSEGVDAQQLKELQRRGLLIWHRPEREL